jgi:hypothetical protein
MANIPDSDARVAVKVDLPKTLDRAMEIQAARLDVTKRQFIEDAIRAALIKQKALSEDAA